LVKAEGRKGEGGYSTLKEGSTGEGEDIGGPQTSTKERGELFIVG